MTKQSHDIGQQKRRRRETEPTPPPREIYTEAYARKLVQRGLADPAICETIPFQETYRKVKR